MKKKNHELIPETPEEVIADGQENIQADVDAIMRDPNLSPVLEVMAKKLRCGTDKTRETFLAFFGIAHGLASLLANNSMQYDEELCRNLLENVFGGLTAARKGGKHA